MQDRRSGVGVRCRVNELHGGGASSDGHARCARSVGHACRARRSGMDRQTLFGGPDKQVPPLSAFQGRIAIWPYGEPLPKCRIGKGIGIIMAGSENGGNGQT